MAISIQLTPDTEHRLDSDAGMNVEHLLTHFDRIADAADAVPRLRRFILDLAVRGKLVPQDPNDEPASGLLRQVTANKEKLIHTGKIRRSRIQPELKGVLPYTLPSGWTWAPFGSLHYLVRGVTYSKSDVADHPMPGYVAILRANNISSNLTHDEPVFVKSERVAADQFLRSGDFMIALSSGSKNLVGKAALVPKDLDEAFGGFCGVIRLYAPKVHSFVGVYLQSALYREGISAGSRGIGINNLKQKILSNLAFPLPPLAEQHRIVAKVDELMALCDRLEAARTGRETTLNRLSAASLARLNAPDPDPPVFRNDAAFALDNLTPLTTRPDQIKALRQTILNLAVRGKLVPQDPNDEPASELLKKIAVERNDLVTQKLIRREKPLTEIHAKELPFNLPRGWEWSRIGNAVLFTQYGTSTKAYPSQQGVPVLTMGNIQDGMVVWWNEKRIPSTAEELPALYLKQFDLLYNRTNSAELVGKTGIYLGEDDCRTFASYLIRVRASRENFSPHFLNLTMNTSEFRESQIVPLIKQQTGQANVNGTALRHMVVPIPPLAEQHRIVAKVDELMALCERLEACLAAGDETRGRLLESVLHEALEVAAVGDHGHG